MAVRRAFAFGEEEREQILISYFAGEEFRPCLSFFPTENYSRTLLKPLLRQERSGSVCCFSVLIRSSLTKSKPGVTRNSWMLQAQHDLKIKRFSVKRHMVLLNPGSHRWPCLSSGHKTKPKDVCVRKGRRGKVTGVGGDGNETYSIYASVITKHAIQRLFL